MTNDMPTFTVDEVFGAEDAIHVTANRARAAFDLASRVAPRPASRDADSTEWARHYSALALAAHGVFREAEATLTRPVVKGSRPDLGYLTMLAVAATAAAAALTEHPDVHAETLFALTPDTGEDVDWLAATLDRLGVNPADLYRWYDAADFNSPSVAVTA